MMSILWRNNGCPLGLKQRLSCLLVFKRNIWFLIFIRTYRLFLYLCLLKLLKPEHLDSPLKLFQCFPIYLDFRSLYLLIWIWYYFDLIILWSGTSLTHFGYYDSVDLLNLGPPFFSGALSALIKHVEVALHDFFDRSHVSALSVGWLSDLFILLVDMDNEFPLSQPQ